MDRFRPVLDFQPQLRLHAAAAVTGAGGVEIGFGLAGNLLRHKFDRFAHRQDGSGKKCGQKEKYLVVHEVKPFGKSVEFFRNDFRTDRRSRQKFWVDQTGFGCDDDVAFLFQRGGCAEQIFEHRNP